MPGIMQRVLMKHMQAAGFEWLVHSTVLKEPGSEVGIWVDPFNIQIMHKPESEDEEQEHYED